MAGTEVSRSSIDGHVSDAVLALRSAFEKIENVAKFLTNNPNTLVSTYGYTADEAYLISVVFETWEAIRVANAANFDTARKLTGLD